MAADAGIVTNTLDDLRRVESADGRVRIEFIEIGDTQRQVCIGEEFDGLGLGGGHDQRGDVVVDRAFLKQTGELFGGRGQFAGEGRSLRYANNNAAGVQIVVQGMPFAQELGAEEEFPSRVALDDTFGVPNRNGGLDHDDRIRVLVQNLLNNVLHVGRVKVVSVGIVVGGSSDDDEFRVCIYPRLTDLGGEIKFHVSEIVLDLSVLNGG